MVKNHEIKFPCEKEFKEGLTEIRNQSPKLRLTYSKTGFYYALMKFAVKEARKKNFENLEPSIEFKKKD